MNSVDNFSRRKLNQKKRHLDMNNKYEKLLPEIYLVSLVLLLTASYLIPVLPERRLHDSRLVLLF